MRDIIHQEAIKKLANGGERRATSAAFDASSGRTSAHAARAPARCPSGQHPDGVEFAVVRTADSGLHINGKGRLDLSADCGN